MGGKVIAAGVVGLLVGVVGGAAATWGLDPADESVVEDLMTDIRVIDGVSRAAVTLETRATAVPGEAVRWG